MNTIRTAAVALTLACACTMSGWAKDVTLTDWGRVSVPDDTRVIRLDTIPGLTPTQAVKIEPVEKKKEEKTVMHPLYEWAREQQARMTALANIRITSVSPDTDTHETVVKRRAAQYTGYQIISPHGNVLSTAVWMTMSVPKPAKMDAYDIKWHMGEREWEDLLHRHVLNEEWLEHATGAAVTVTEWEDTYSLRAGSDDVVTAGARFLLHTDGGAVVPLSLRVYGRYYDDRMRLLTVCSMDDDRNYFADFTESALANMRDW